MQYSERSFTDDYADVSVTINGYTEIGFRNWDGSPIIEAFDIEWKLDGTDIWNKTSVLTPSFILPFSGKSKMRFVDKQYKCVFGNNIPEHAAAFTEIEFGEDYRVEDFARIFENCVSLVSMPSLGHSWDTTRATNMSEMFAGATTQLEGTSSINAWDSRRIYNTGDIIRYDGNMYLAIESILGINPDEDKDNWLLIPDIETKPKREEIPLKVRENIAGISNCDIPE